MNEQELARLEALAAAATPGPWNTYECRHHSGGNGPSKVDYQVSCAKECVAWDMPSSSNAAFIAAAREAVPVLVAEVRRLREEMAEMRPVGMTSDDVADLLATACSPAEAEARRADARRWLAKVSRPKGFAPRVVRDEADE
jgi:sirohydrochlorin ferrochelatase